MVLACAAFASHLVGPSSGSGNLGATVAGTPLGMRPFAAPPPAGNPAVGTPHGEGPVAVPPPSGNLPKNICLSGIAALGREADRGITTFGKPAAPDLYACNARSTSCGH